MLKKSIFATIFLVSIIFQGCTVEKVDESSDINEMVASNEFVLSSTQHKQYIIKDI